MPLNEAAGWRRSNLTKAQRREAEAALYGLNVSESMDLSREEIERMRTIVAQHDQAAGKGGIREFDINNPPKVPYVHQEYPRVMYHHGKREMRLAHNAEDVQEAMALGWKKEPFLADVPAQESEPPAVVDQIRNRRAKRAQPDEE